MEYVIIHGLAPTHLGGQGDAELRDYIEGIIYGVPERIFGTLLDSGKFVALVEYDDESRGASTGTFARMGSFSYGSQYLLDTGLAFQEFGTWIAHYSGHKGVGRLNRPAAWRS